jgi:uroporphyrin-III C-methyltransferase/precorrin-2 dehydrogenase/sirohydrochlorin ferrochelatase
MGLLGLPLLCSRLIAHGRDPATPAAIVQQGTTPSQRVLEGSLATLPGIVAAAGLHAPTLIIVGEVVALGRRCRDAAPARGGQSTDAP